MVDFSEDPSFCVNIFATGPPNIDSSELYIIDDGELCITDFERKESFSGYTITLPTTYRYMAGIEYTFKMRFASEGPSGTPVLFKLDTREANPEDKSNEQLQFTQVDGVVVIDGVSPNYEILTYVLTPSINLDVPSISIFPNFNVDSGSIDLEYNILSCIDYIEVCSNPLPKQVCKSLVTFKENPDVDVVIFLTSTSPTSYTVEDGELCIT